MVASPRILVIDDQPGMRRSLAILLRKEAYDVTEAESGQDAISFLGRESFDVVVTDLKMSPGTGLDVLYFLREKAPLTQVVIMTGYATVESAVIAMRIGACDYIAKPFKNEEILHRVAKAVSRVENRKAIDEVVGDTASGTNGTPLIGVSEFVVRLRDLIQKFARVDLPLLITGETGTGKSLVARTVHNAGPRATGPFIAVNCAGVPENLLESELFGHVKGAFTGAFLERKGLFQEAKGGTLLLDEIGSMSVTMQAKLLDVLQEQYVRPVGSNQQIPVDVRIITATNTALEQAISEGLFREDLYYRIRVTHIHIPPVREHPEDIPFLIQHGLGKMRKELRRPELDLSPEALDFLCSYDYPGNVRELLNGISSAAAVANGNRIGIREITMSLTSRLFDLRSDNVHGGPSTLEEWEMELIQKSIEKHSRNLGMVCKELGIARTTLWRKMNKYGLR